MSTHALDADVTSRRRWRLSLAGLLAFTFGVSAAFAAARASHSGWHDGLLAAFAAWFLAGCLGQAIALRKWLQRQQDLPWNVRFAVWMSMTVRIAAPLAVALAVAMLVNAETTPFRWPASRRSSLVESPLFVWLTIGLIVIPVIVLVRPLRVAKATSRRNYWRHAAVMIGTLASLTIAFLLASDSVLLASLVHLAIRGMEANQPYYVRGELFGPASVDLATFRSFAKAGVLATALWLAGGLLFFAATRQWGRGRISAFGTSAIAAITICCNWIVLVWGYQVFVAQVSPILGPFVARQPMGVWLLAALLTAITGYWFTTQLSQIMGVKPLAAALYDGEQNPRQFLHERPVVLLLPIMW